MAQYCSCVPRMNMNTAPNSVPLHQSVNGLVGALSSQGQSIRVVKDPRVLEKPQLQMSETFLLRYPKLFLVHC